MRAALSLLVSLLTPLLAATAQAQAAGSNDTDTLLGEWWTPGFNARVRIEACGETVCGHIVWAWDDTPPDITDKRPLVGRKVIEGMHPAGAARWAGGRLYNPEDGRDYKGQLQLQSASSLLVEGCILFVCRKQVWRQVDVGRCPPVASAG